MYIGTRRRFIDFVFWRRNGGVNGGGGGGGGERSSNQGHERTPAGGPGYLTASLLYLDGHCRAYRHRNCTRTIF